MFALELDVRVSSLNPIYPRGPVRFAGVAAALPPEPSQPVSEQKKGFSLAKTLNKWSRAANFFIPIMGGVAVAWMWPNKRLLGWLEDKGLFRPSAPVELVDLESKSIAAQLQEVSFTAADGPRLRGWYAPAQPGKYTILYSYDNASRLTDAERLMKPLLEAGYGFMGYDYRGYGKSEGTPTEAGLSQDLEAASRFLEEKGVPASEQVLVGKCLGSGVSVDVASRHPSKFRAVVLMSTPTNMPELLSQMKQTIFKLPTWAFKVEHHIRQKFDSESKIAGIRSPLLLVHGQLDPITPIGMALRLYDKATSPQKNLMVIPTGKHYLLKHASTKITQAVESLRMEAELLQQTSVSPAVSLPAGEA